MDGDRRRKQNGARSRVGRALDIQHRSNITLAKLQDKSRANKTEWVNGTEVQGRLAKGASILKAVELFAGAGGMG